MNFNDGESITFITTFLVNVPIVKVYSYVPNGNGALANSVALVVLINHLVASASFNAESALETVALAVEFSNSDFPF